jgi:hypothetical protein
MKLGPANRELFGKTPRYVGLVGPERGKDRNQFLAFDRSNFKIFLESNYKQHNMYTRISHIDNGSSVLDEVFFDLDIDKPPGADDYASDMIPKMKADRLVADNVLGDVIEDARKLGRYLKERQWPTIAVFSGLGIHVHALTEPCVQADKKLKTTVRKVEDKTDIETLDTKGARQGDYNRLCRLANCPRISKDGNEFGLFTIPLTRDELCDITAEKLLDWSESPRQIKTPLGDRPEMKVHDEYITNTKGGVADVDIQEVGDVMNEHLEEQFEVWLKDVLQMPCMYERLMTRNPDHNVRLNCAVLLFNCGLMPKDVKEIYRKLGWFDWDGDVTESHLHHIYEKGYHSMSCQTIQEKGLCVYDRENREDCSEFGRNGGQCNF